jgi:hypothetical protein
MPSHSGRRLIRRARVDGVPTSRRGRSVSLSETTPADKAPRRQALLSRHAPPHPPRPRRLDSRVVTAKRRSGRVRRQQHSLARSINLFGTAVRNAKTSALLLRLVFDALLRRGVRHRRSRRHRRRRGGRGRETRADGASPRAERARGARGGAPRTGPRPALAVRSPPPPHRGLGSFGRGGGAKEGETRRWRPAAGPSRQGNAYGGRGGNGPTRPFPSEERPCSCSNPARAAWCAGWGVRSLSANELIRRDSLRPLMVDGVSRPGWWCTSWLCGDRGRRRAGSATSPAPCP